MRHPQDLSYHNNMNSWYSHVSMYSAAADREFQKYISEMKAALRAIVDQTVWYGDDTFPDEILRRRNRTW